MQGLRSIHISPYDACVMSPMHGLTIPPLLPGTTARLKACEWTGCQRGDVGNGSISTKLKVSTSSPLSLRNSPSKRASPIGRVGHASRHRRFDLAAGNEPMLTHHV